MLKNIQIIIVLVLVGYLNVVGQELFKYNPDVFGPTGLKSTSVLTQYLPNGGCFTPKGSLKALIIFASFGGSYDQQAVGGWPSSSTFPDWATSATKPFYTTDAEFANSASDNNIKSVSKFYYDMSNQKLKLYVDYYPTRIIVNASTCANWAAVNQKVIAQIPSSFNWATYDSRKNDPNYYYDYSGNLSDTKPDFVIICYRFSYSWSNFPVAGMNGGSAWCGGCNGYSSNQLSGTTSNGYTFTDDGFTHVTGASDIAWMFIHETGHSLYNAPHYNGNNQVAGDYFYIPIAGWGMMSMNTFCCALGWERWMLDWVNDPLNPFKANGVNADVKTIADLPSNGEFTLRDFITTGDMVRIQIPNGTVKNQYLWIENHQGKSIFDNNGNPNPFCGANVPNSPRGIIAYVETINDNKNSVTNYTNGNGIRWLHADGNYDFNFDPTPLNPTLAYCNNTTYNITKGVSNPIGGQNTGEYIRKDFDNNGLTYNQPLYGDLDNSARNEGTPVVVYNGITSADYFMGKNMAFIVGQKAGISENPCIMNIPTFSLSTAKMESYYLNGISFSVISQDAQGNIKIQVKLDDVDINKDIRIAGTSIILDNITGNSNPDINLLEGKTITINRSGTENTNAQISGKYINYTNFYCENNSFFKMQANSTVYLDDNSTFTLKSGSTLEVNDGAKFIVKNGSKLAVESGATILIKGSGGIITKCTGTLCVNSGATLNLQDFSSCIHFIGTGGLSSGCLSSLSGVITGNGSVQNHNSALTLSNSTISSDVYYSGTTITSNNVAIQGTGTDVVYDATDGVTINGNFDVPVGSTFEVKLSSTSCAN